MPLKWCQEMSPEDVCWLPMRVMEMTRRSLQAINTEQGCAWALCWHTWLESRHKKQELMRFITCQIEMARLSQLHVQTDYRCTNINRSRLWQESELKFSQTATLMRCVSSAQWGSKTAAFSEQPRILTVFNKLQWLRARPHTAGTEEWLRVPLGLSWSLLGHDTAC